MRLECGVGFRQLRTCRRKRSGATNRAPEKSSVRTAVQMRLTSSEHILTD